jgi:hypothetical protein
VPQLALAWSQGVCPQKPYAPVWTGSGETKNGIRSPVRLRTYPKKNRNKATKNLRLKEIYHTAVEFFYHCQHTMTALKRAFWNGAGQLKMGGGEGKVGSQGKKGKGKKKG